MSYKLVFLMGLVSAGLVGLEMTAMDSVDPRTDAIMQEVARRKQEQLQRDQMNQAMLQLVQAEQAKQLLLEKLKAAQAKLNQAESKLDQATTGHSKASERGTKRGR